MSEEPEPRATRPVSPFDFMGQGLDQLLLELPALPGLLRELNENVAALVQELRAWRSQRAKR